jgi:hypothetical protein
MNSRDITAASTFRTLYLDFRVWLGLKLFEQPTSLDRNPCSTINIGFGQILKPDSSENEVHVLDFLRQATTIPIPKVYGAWWRTGCYQYPGRDEKRQLCMVMSKMPGRTFHHVLREKEISVPDVFRLLLQLKDYIQQLRNIPQPSAMEGRICSFIGGDLDDPGLTIFEKLPPFTRPAFVDYLLDVYIEDREAKEARFREVLACPEDQLLLLTHADLHPGNIMVEKRKDGSCYVSGIIDWTTAGWYPSYWEYYRSSTELLHTPKIWKGLVQIFAGKYMEQYSVLSELSSKTFR